MDTKTRPIYMLYKEDVVCVYTHAHTHAHTHTHTHTGILLNHKKNEFLLFAATWMDLENIMHGEISQTEKGKYYIKSFKCGM